MTSPMVRPGWAYYPATPGHPERYVRAEAAVVGGAAISLEVVNYYGASHDPDWTGWLRLLGGYAGQIVLPVGLGPDADAAIAGLEAAARGLGQRLIELGTPPLPETGGAE